MAFVSLDDLAKNKRPKERGTPCCEPRILRPPRLRVRRCFTRAAKVCTVSVVARLAAKVVFLSTSLRTATSCRRNVPHLTKRETLQTIHVRQTRSNFIQTPLIRAVHFNDFKRAIVHDRTSTLINMQSLDCFCFYLSHWQAHITLHRQDHDRQRQTQLWRDHLRQGRRMRALLVSAYPWIHRQRLCRYIHFVRFEYDQPFPVHSS